jgi:hypothetical protein
MTTLAAAYLDAVATLGSAEHAIAEALSESPLLPADWDFHGDPYDRSIELYSPGAAPENAAAIGALLLSMGFSRCWLHLHENGRTHCRMAPYTIESPTHGTLSGTKCDREHYFARPRPEPPT